MKNTLFKSTFILLIGGIITKILSMIIRIVLSRMLGENLGSYMIIIPTFTLLISLASLGLPGAISKLVAEEKRNNKNLVFSIIPITLLFDLFIIAIIILLSDFISTKLLHLEGYKYVIISMGLVLPFIDISSVLRGYFFGKQKMIPHVISNITEDIIRLIVIIIFLPYFLKKGIINAVIFIILTNIISELTSILVLFIFLPKNFSISKKDFKLNYKNIEDTMKIGIPSTMSRLVGSIGYFLEPIILTYVLLNIGYDNNFITHEYGIIEGLVMPILLLPSFFTYSISSALLPIISKSHINKEYTYTKKKIKQAVFYSLVIGIPFTILIMIYPNIPLNILYHTNDGINYIRFLAPICLLHYIQAPLTSAMQAMNMANSAFKGTLIGTIIRIVSLFILCYLNIGLYSLLISTGINMLYVTLHHMKKIKNHLR